MHSALFIVKSHATELCKDAFMPNVWMNIEAFTAIKCKADKLLRRDVIRWERKRHKKRLIL
jgi:hypothetical protein